MRAPLLCILAAAAAPLLAIATDSSSARAQAVVVYPTSAYVAAYEPVYYNGFAHYWYRDRWFYRDHGAWRWYDHEPGFLHDRRGEWGHHWHHWR
jgi:hypothetical protein